MDKSKPDCSDLGSLRRTIEKSSKPMVLKNCLENWPCLGYSLDDWGSLFRGKLLKFRCGKKPSISGGVFQWERECVEAVNSLEEFITWQATRQPLPSDNQNMSLLNHESCDDVWAYYDYKYMNEAFDDNESILQDINWGGCGFPERDGRHSTLWIGSAGAFTPCHYDTYGFNLVAQLYGKKQWLLYPPKDGIFLEPTRIPYEESSVYSRINFNTAASDLDSVGGTPHMVTLVPGDLLVVPHQWWHYVENLETSVSVNTWVEMPADKPCRLQEAIVKFVMGNIARNVPEALQSSLLNPNEDSLSSLSLEELLSYIRISAVEEHLTPADGRDVSTVMANQARASVTMVPVPEMSVRQSSKKRKLDCSSSASSKSPHKDVDQTTVNNEFPSGTAPIIPYISRARTADNSSELEGLRHSTFMSIVTDSICHPDVICKIADAVRSKLRYGNFVG